MQLMNNSSMSERAGDGALIGFIALGGALLTWHLANLFPSEFFGSIDLWFGADQNRVLSNMSELASNHERTKVHPIFSLLFYPPTRGLMEIGIEPLAAARFILAVSAAASVSAIYATVRLLSLKRLEAAQICLAYVGSASFIFWSGLVETFPFGGLTVALVILISVLKPTNAVPWVVGSAASLAITVTNWSIGILTSFYQLSWRRFILVNASALLVVVAGALVQKTIFPSSTFFLSPNAVSEEKNFLLAAKSTPDFFWQVTARAAGFWHHTGISPKTRLVTFQRGSRIKKTVISAGLRSISVLSTVALASWIVMLCLGFWAVVQRNDLHSITVPISMFLGFQMVLHIVYGDAPFLYSMHFLPAMIIVSAIGFLGPLPAWSRIATIAFIISAGISNYMHFRGGVELLRSGAF
jgi:hypothetical protein